MIITQVTSGSVAQAVSGTAAQFGAMVPGAYYAFTCSTACWIAQSANPTATAATGSMYVPANTLIYLNGSSGAKLSVLQASAGGTATLTPVMYY